MADAYASGVASTFVLHGNVYDLVAVGDAAERRFCDLSEFLATQLFGRWDITLHYDLGRGLRALAGGDALRLKRINAALGPLWGEPASWPHDPDRVLAQLDRLVERILIDAAPAAPRPSTVDCRSAAIVFDHAQFLAPPGDAQTLAPSAAARVVRLLGWGQNPYIRRGNIAFCLIAERISELSERLAQSPHVATIEIPLPDRALRREFLAFEAAHVANDEQERLADLSAGLSLINLRVLLNETRGRTSAASMADATTAAPAARGDDTAFRRLKKSLIERQCGDLVEFMEPQRTLDDIVGHDAVRARLAQDARWLAEGRFDISPMGYLVCGPVGTGKSFLAECYAGSVGMPCVKLRNVRSKYVGETEANLQRVLTVLRSLGPVVVVIDEADAALGSRQAEGDSGTSSRVFAMLAEQMGDTRYRGRIVWMLLTSRPDLLPIDLKRQGRAEVHLPLFYPQTAAEVAPMFAAMAAKNRVPMAEGTLDVVSSLTDASGADIEAIVLSARRRALAAGRDEVSPVDAAAAVAAFLPSTESLEKQCQELTAVLECTDIEFLPAWWQAKLREPGGRDALQRQRAELRRADAV